MMRELVERAIDGRGVVEDRPGGRRVQVKQAE